MSNESNEQPQQPWENFSLPDDHWVLKAQPSFVRTTRDSLKHQLNSELMSTKAMFIVQLEKEGLTEQDLESLDKQSKKWMWIVCISIVNQEQLERERNIVDPEITDVIKEMIADFRIPPLASEDWEEEDIDFTIMTTLSSISSMSKQLFEQDLASGTTLDQLKKMREDCVKALYERDGMQTTPTVKTLERLMKTRKMYQQGSMPEEMLSESIKFCITISCINKICDEREQG